MADILTRFDVPPRHRPPDASSVEDALDKSVIAELSPIQIARMSRSELVRVIQAANMTLTREEISRRLKLYDRETLERLVFLARRCCRNQGY